MIQLAEDGQVAKIEVRGDKLNVMTNDGEIFTSRKEKSDSVLELLDARGIATGGRGILVEVKGKGTSIGGVFVSLVPLILFGALIFWMFRRARGGVNQALSIGKSQARIVDTKPSLTFTDVAGHVPSSGVRVRHPVDVV